MGKLLDPIYMILHIVNLIVIVFVLKKILYKPIKKFMAARKDALAQETKELDDTKQTLTEIQADIDAKNEAYEHRVKEEYNETMQKAYAKAESVIQKANVNAQKILDEAAQKTKEKQTELLRQQREAAANLAVDIAANIIPRQLNEQDHLTLLEQSLKEAEQNGV